MNEKNGSLKFWIWQNEKMVLLSLVAPLVYTVMMSLIDGDINFFSEGNLAYMYIMFGIVVFVSYSTSMGKTLIPLAVSMGATRKETVKNVIYTNIMMFVQIWLAATVVKFIVTGSVDGLLIFAGFTAVIMVCVVGISNFIAGFIVTNSNNTIMVVVLIILMCASGFSFGFFAAFADEHSIEFAIEFAMAISPYILSVASVLTIVLYICSVWFIGKRMKNYEVRV